MHLWAILLFLPYSHSFLTCSKPPCPCFPSDDRPEVRQLSAEERGRVSAAFRNARHLVPKAAWNQPGKTMCLLVNSLDAALRPLRFPYWASRVEERMSNPKDSFIFLGRFFPDKSMRRKRRRIRERRFRSDLSPLTTMSPRLFAALQTGRHAQLLSFMHSVGLQMTPFVNDTCESLCTGSSEFLSCSGGLCWSKLQAGAICSENALPACYQSICVNSICSVPSSKRNNESREIYQVIQEEGLAIVRMPDEVGKSTRDENGIEGSGEAAAAKVYYHVQTTTQTADIFTVANTLATLDFNASLPFPTVYIPISITKGRHNRRQLDNLHELSVRTEGGNLPNGYTQHISGLITNSSRAYIRILDPSLTTLVEASISVELNGRKCKATCLQYKDYYKPCPSKLRLSRYSKISDPVQWYKVPSDIPTKWTGSGYYKRPTNDFFLFKCI